ncbi:MAG: FAD-dependent oxidoreductase [Myxococcota bacterium]
MKKRVVIVGFGDTGLLVAIHLGQGFEVVAISTKPCWISGQELGTRLTQPSVWKQNYLEDYDRFTKLDGVRILHGHVVAVNATAQWVDVALSNGESLREAYDALVIATGVTNGFWRNDTLEDIDTVQRQLAERALSIERAHTVAIVGGGATGTSVAANVKERFPETSVHLFYSQDRPLPSYHPQVRQVVERRLRGRGVQLHPGHRANIPVGFRGDDLTTGPVTWSTGQPAFSADLTLWAVGQVRPNSGFLPPEMLDDRGFVKTDPYLRVQGTQRIFAVGDIAATDKHRSSARNWGFRVVAYNLRATLRGRATLRKYRAPPYRWGSILGVERDGLRVFQPNGGHFRFPHWVVRRLLFPIVVRQFIYRGIRPSK